MYEIPDDALFTWAFIDGRVVLTGERIVASYVEPAAETDAQPGEEFRDDIDGSVEDAGEIITNAGEDFEEKDGSGEEETAAVISGTDEDAREIIADSGEDDEDKDGSGEEEAAGAIPGTDEDAAESVTKLPAPSPGLMKMPRRASRVPERMIRKRMTRKRIRTAPETGKLPPSYPKSTKNRSPGKPFPAQLTARGGRPLCSSPGKISAGYRRILC